MANLQELCSVCGVSGFECQTGISEFLYQKARTICLNTHRDKKGNIISIVGTGNTKVLIDAHMDEVGFSIIGLSKDGIELRPIGVFTLSRIAGEGVFIIGKNVTGVLKIYDECIFFVPDSPDDTHKCAIHDLVSFKRTFQIQPNNEIEATALDNRVGCAILLELLENIIPPENATFVYVFSVQEEINNSNLNEIILHYGIDYGIVVESAYALPVHFDTKGMIIPELGQ